MLDLLESVFGGPRVPAGEQKKHVPPPKKDDTKIDTLMKEESDPRPPSDFNLT